MTLIESLLLITNLLTIFLCYLNHIGIKLLMKIIKEVVDPKNQQLPRKSPPKEF